MVWHGAHDHTQRSLRVRSKHHRRSGPVHRHRRPPFPPAQRGSRLRQFPRRPYVANDHLAQKFSLRQGCDAGTENSVVWCWNNSSSKKASSCSLPLSPYNNGTVKVHLTGPTVIGPAKPRRSLYRGSLHRAFCGGRLLLLPAEVPNTKYPSDQSYQNHPVEHQAFAKLLAHRKWELGDKFLTMVVLHSHDTDEFPVLRECMFKGQRARRIFLWRQIGDSDRIEAGFVRQLRVGQKRKPIHTRMGSIVPDEADFREHVAQLGVLHIERDNRLPNTRNIVAKLFPGILRLVSGEEHQIWANPQNASIVLHAHAAMGICA